MTQQQAIRNALAILLQMRDEKQNTLAAVLDEIERSDKEFDQTVQVLANLADLTIDVAAWG